MSKQVIVYRLKGRETVSVLTPIEASIASCLVRLKEEHGEDLVFYRIVNKEDVPVDRYFRNAWIECEEKAIKHDIEKCKKIHVDNLRIERNKKLAELDAPMLRALEDDNKELVAELKAMKQELRDMPANLDMDNLNSLEEIKAVRPDIL